MPGMDDARHLFDRLPSPGKRLALVAAILVHVLLAIFLLYGIRWQDKAPTAVEVDLVRSMPDTAPPAPALTPPPPKPVPPVKPPPPPPPPPKKIEPPKPDIALKDKPEKKPEPKPEVKPPPKPQYDPMKEMLRQETEQQKRKQLQDALAREEAQNQSAAADAAARSKGLAEYGDKIRAKIRSNVFAPPGATGNPEVEFVITQIQGAEGGIITDVRLRKSSGQPALDEAVERAIRKSSPLPLPDRKEDFTRTVTLKLRPLEQNSTP